MTKDDYKKAVAGLMDLAEQCSGGSRVAAQVLLSAYNGFDFQLDVSDMGNLDRKNFELAMAVIRGRYECGMEPHNALPDGDNRFDRLYDRFKGRFHVTNRGKVDCPKCDGRGRIYKTQEEDEPGVPCEYCLATGRVCACKGRG